MIIDWESHIELKILKESLIGQFELQGYLGGGGYGKVFKLKDKKLDRECALKVLNFHRLNRHDEQERGKIKQRFIREAKNYARCNHPNIVQIYEIGGEDTFPYLIIQYIKGKNLQELISEKNRLAFSDILEISGGLLPAVSHMHKNEIIHRDLKPSNIMIEEGSKRAVIIDFGFSKSSGASSLTITGTAYGTPAYMAPEQWKDFKGADSRVDIYAYGVMLYKMISGEAPFKGTQMQVMEKHLHQPVPKVSKKNPKAPPGIQEIIDKAMGKKPGSRYRSADKLLDALKNVENPGKTKDNRFKLYFLLSLVGLVIAVIIIFTIIT